MKTMLQIGMVLLISTGMLHAQMLKEHGDAPEGALAYPDNGIIGQFPSCKMVLPNGFIEHTNFGAWFGPGFDFEPDGNAGNCPMFTPNLYNMDECINDGDAGLTIPGAFTITGMPGSETYVPCGPGSTAPLGFVCSPVVWGQNIDIFVHNTMPNATTGFFNLLIDWNRDGQWGGAVLCTQGQVQVAVQEHVLINFPIPAGYVGMLSNLLPPNSMFLCGPVPGYVWTRFTITEVPVFLPWNGTGSFEDGETEDYLLHVGTAQPVQIDWGDAPDPAYPTLQASNGAQHQIVPGILLGSLIDAEADGQASALANGDDNLATDDEDGVTIKWGLLSGSPGNVEVLASVAGFLDAWCDFNADGDWADAGEQIFVSVPLVAGANRLSFSIPLLSSQTDTYFRYRFSQTGGLSFSGPAPNGEVEDYSEVISSNSQYKWKQDPDNNLPGLHCHDKVINQAYQQIYYADDWQCNGGQVTEIIWYGAYENPGSGIEKFNIKVYANNSQTCLPLPNPPPPPDSFFDVFVSLSALNETPTGILNSDGQMIYSYSYTLPVPFPQITGNRYWLALSSISNDTLNAAIWKWQEASRSHIPALCPSANMTVINNLPALWNPINLANGTHPEMAFQIMNIPTVPVLPTDFIIQAGAWIEAEPWHNWIGGEITDTLSFRLFAHDSLHRIQMVQFFYSSDSINWSLLGTDTSGQEAPSTAGAYDSITPGNGWAVHYPVAMLSSVYLQPVQLHLRTEIMLDNGEILMYTKPETVSFDPSPPSSFTTNIPEWYSTYKDSLEVSVIPGLANAQSWYYVIDKKDLRFNKGIPDAGQQNPLFPNGGAAYCAPTSTAACFKYFEGKGDNTICGGLSTNGLIRELGKVCKTDPFKGTEFKGWVAGIRKWLEEHGDNYTVRTVEFWKKDANGADIYTFNFYRWLFMRNELEHRQDVLVDMAWFTTPYNWNGAHAVTFNSVWNIPVNGKFRVDFMDPWTKKQEFGWLDPNTGDITGYANSTGYSNLNAKITNLIIICPKEQAIVPLSGGTPVSGYSPPSKKIRILLPGPNFLRVYCQDQDGFQFRKDIVFEWLQADFGDAPDSYQTLLASDGPRHLLDTVTFMGDTIDYDNDGIPTANADGDDLLNIDDEDGVVFASAIYRNDTTNITVTASVQGAFLQAWIDFNQNGTFESPAEQILTDAIVVAGQNTYPILIPPGATIGNTYARFRLSTQGGLLPFGPAPDGEVEDYRITILEEEFDMGDAPDPGYPTLVSSNGAKHKLNPNLYLGYLIDIETNGQPDPSADGDNLNGINDEDGIIFSIPPAAGNPCIVEVIASNSYAGTMYLNAWFDFNADGDWADAGEQVFTDKILTSGTQYLSFIVPPDAVSGNTFARFRLSSQTGLSFTGYAQDGEVEDYQVDIISLPENVKWRQTFNSNLPGIHAHDYEQNQTNTVLSLADDWLCYGNDIYDIHWWGNYEEDGNGNEMRGSGVNHFYLAIHTDQQGIFCGPVEPPVWTAVVPIANAWETATGINNSESCQIYRYSHYLSIPFQQEAGNTYWLEIAAFSTDPATPARWRWQECYRTRIPILCTAEQKSETNGIPGIWSPLNSGQGMDHLNMAFEITSTPPYADINGTSYYHNSMHNPMTATDILLHQGPIILDTNTTNSEGAFSFQVSANNAYQLSALSDKPWGGGNSTDALLILKHFVHMITLEGLFAEAGDVDNSGGINSLDALLTARRFIGSITSFAAGDWVFENPTISVPIPGTYTQNIGALCTGDVNGSYTPTAKEDISVEIVPDQLITASHEMMLPVRCESAITLGAVSLVLGLPDGITITDIKIPDHANHGTLLFHQTGNEVRISWFDTEARDASSGEILFILHARTDLKSEGQIVTLAGSLISDADGRNYEYVRLLGPMITQENNTEVFMSVNIPNPFKGITEIWYSIPESGTVDLFVYNAMGEVVKELVNSKQQQAGLYHILFDCQGCSPGLYYYKLTTKTAESVMQKQQNMILLK